MEIPEQVVVALGLGAMLKDIYKIFMQGSVKSYGSLLTTTYITLVYTALLTPGLISHGSPFVRVGITLVLLDKVVAFTYDLLSNNGYSMYQQIREKLKIWTFPQKN